MIDWRKNGVFLFSLHPCSSVPAMAFPAKAVETRDNKHTMIPVSTGSSFFHGSSILLSQTKPPFSL